MTVSRYSWILHLTCIAISAFFLAQTLTTLLASFLEGGAGVVEVGRSRVLAGAGRGGAEAPAPPELETFAIIAERNIFNSEESGVAAEGTGEELSLEMLGELGEAVKTSLDVKVLGTLVMGEGTDRRSSATVSGGEAKGGDVYFVGEERSFAPSVRLTKVARERIEFVNGARLEYAELEDFASKTSIFGRSDEVHGAAGALGGAGGEVEETKEPTASGAGKIMIDQREIDDALSNLDKLYTEIRIVPNFQGGKAAGFKVLSVKAGSVVGKLGIKRGDVLERINGEELSVQKGLELFTMLKDQKNFSIDLVRRGKNTTFEYEIR